MSSAQSLGAPRIRRSDRFRVPLNIPVRLGWKSGTLLDVSAVGLFVTHTGSLQVGAVVEVTFNVSGGRFAGAMTVVSCNVIGLGTGEGGATVYGSRLSFTRVPEDSMTIVEGLLTAGGAPSNE
jgi:hypothetical protein